MMLRISRPTIPPAPRPSRPRVRSGERSRFAACCFLACLITSCTGSATQLQRPQGDPGTGLRRVQERLALEGREAPEGGGARTARRTTLVAFTHGEDAELLAFDLEHGEVRWRAAFQAQAKPRVAGDTVFTADAEHVVAFDLEDGRRLWRTPTHGLKLVGGGRDGAYLIYALRSASMRTRAEARLVCVDVRDGDVVWERRIVGWVGAPVATAGLAFVPWNRQTLAVVDLESGKPWVQLRPASGAVEWADVFAGDVRFGEDVVYRVGAIDELPVGNGSKPIEAYADLPADPALHPSAYRWVPATRSALGRIALHAPLQASAGDEVGSDTAYFIYYRYVFGLSTDGTLSWARILPHDVVAARRVPDGLQVALESGDVRILDAAAGRARRSWRMPSPIASVAFAGGFAAAPVAEAQQDARDGNATRSAALRESLVSVALDPDTRLIDARAFAIRRLAALSEPRVTRDLLDLYVQRGMPPTLRQQIIEILQRREQGQQYVVEALQRDQDFLAGSGPPPLEALVPAVVAMQARDAVPALARHLLDPATPADVLAELSDAIRKLGDAGTAPTLRRFLALYRADTALREHPRALRAAARALRQHGDREDRRYLASIARQPDTHAALRQPRERDRDTTKRAAAKKRSAKPADLPQWLEQRRIDAELAERAGALRDCIRSELRRRPELYQVRIAFLVRGNGHASNVHVSPASEPLRHCLTNIVVEVRFPRFAARRQMADYVITLREARPPKREAPSSGEREARPWWAWHASHASQAPTRAEKSPWWMAALRQDDAYDASSAKEETEARPWWQIEEGPDASSTPTDASAASRAPQPPRETQKRPWWRIPSEAEDDAAKRRREPDAAKPEPHPWWQSTQP